jgi:hypothetical protein
MDIRIVIAGACGEGAATGCAHATSNNAKTPIKPRESNERIPHLNRRQARRFTQLHDSGVTQTVRARHTG